MSIAADIERIIEVVEVLVGDDGDATVLVDFRGEKWTAMVVLAMHGHWSTARELVILEMGHHDLTETGATLEEAVSKLAARVTRDAMRRTEELVALNLALVTVIAPEDKTEKTPHQPEGGEG